MGIPGSIQEVLTDKTEAEFMAKLDEIADQAFDDQCTGANPRYPLIKDLKQLLIDAYYGRPLVSNDYNGDRIFPNFEPQPMMIGG